MLFRFSKAKSFLKTKKAQEAKNTRKVALEFLKTGNFDLDQIKNYTTQCKFAFKKNSNEIPDIHK